MSSNSDRSLALRVLPDFLAFGIGLGLAYYLKWETRDLVWSLWLCSLTLGYLTILSAIAGGACIGLRGIMQDEFKHKRLPVILIGAAVGLFFLGFFSLHFCGFHAGHSVFLHAFFPITGMPEDGFGDAFMNPPLLWVLVFRHLMKPYGVFLIPAIIAERKHVFLPLARAIQTVRSGISIHEVADETAETGRGRGKAGGLMNDTMGRPYLNVVRMHLLIFFFGFCHAMKVDSFFVYAVVYFVYFFPWAEARALVVRAKRERTGAGSA